MVESAFAELDAHLSDAVERLWGEVHRATGRPCHRRGRACLEEAQLLDMLSTALHRAAEYAVSLAAAHGLTDVPRARVQKVDGAMVRGGVSRPDRLGKEKARPDPVEVRARPVPPKRQHSRSLNVRWESTQSLPRPPPADAAGVQVLAQA